MWVKNKANVFQGTAPIQYYPTELKGLSGGPMIILIHKRSKRNSVEQQEQTRVATEKECRLGKIRTDSHRNAGKARAWG